MDRLRGRVAVITRAGLHTGPRHAWEPEARAERARQAADRRAAYEATLAEGEAE
jgi:hypothetical protein